MITSSTPSHKRDQDPTQVPIERAFLKVFQTVRRKLKFVSVPVEELKDHMLDVLIQAATSKCIDFNIAANRKITHGEMSFSLMSNLRGICEDLIWLTYLARMEKQRAEELIGHLIQLGTLEGLHAQKRFFEANNPTQPVLGNGLKADDEEQSVKKARTELREFWQSMQIKRSDGPTVRNIAENVGLISTYDFIYFAASNFVHFNPNALLRTGWGPEIGGPFTFSIRHMNNYYRYFSSFYGSVLFVGFQASFGTDHFKHALDTQIDRLIELIGHVQRWPEVITFEEMNEKPPLYLLTHALGKVMREEDKTLPYGAILQEVQGECAILSWKLKRLPTPWFDDVGKNNIKPQEKGAEMGSLLRTAKKHKKSRRLGEPEVMAREEYGELEVDVKIEMIRSLIPLGLMHVHELLDDEVKELAGERYARKDELERGRRHGTNPGTVGLAGQRVPIRVPRVRSQEGVEIPLRSYEALNDGGEVNDLLLKRVLYGISCRNYEAAAEAIPGAIGLSSSTVSRGFVQASAAKLREMQERDLSGEDVVALFLDGKSFADAMMVIALGITLSGEKRFLGFVETDTENEKVLTPFLRSLLARGLDSSQGLLVIIDGGKGLKAAVKKAFRKRGLIQRCQWHKRENVVSYLSKGEQASLRKRLQSAYNRPEYKEALAALDQLHDELEERNQSAAASLEEGIEETLTLHRLGVYGVLGRSFKTTNCLESVNALVEERCAKVDHWKNSSQRQRWLATALVDIEPRLRRVIGYCHLPKLREALKRELKIETKTSTVSKKKAA